MVSTDLMNKGYWKRYRFYYVNIQRSPVADKLPARNVNISFITNNAVAIDVMVFIFYRDPSVIGVDSL